jgi:hypothetical protein
MQGGPAFAQIDLCLNLTIRGYWKTEAIDYETSRFAPECAAASNSRDISLTVDNITAGKNRCAKGCLINLIIWVLPNLLLFTLRLNSDKYGSPLERYGRPLGRTI